MVTGNPKHIGKFHWEVGKPEIIDLENPNLICTMWPKIGELSGAFGGFLGLTPIVCGGTHLTPDKAYTIDNSDVCFGYHKSSNKLKTEVNFTGKMKKKLAFAASIIIDYNNLWVTGAEGIIFLQIYLTLNQVLKMGFLKVALLGSSNKMVPLYLGLSYPNPWKTLIDIP